MMKLTDRAFLRVSESGSTAHNNAMACHSSAVRAPLHRVPHLVVRSLALVEVQREQVIELKSDHAA